MSTYTVEVTLVTCQGACTTQLGPVPAETQVIVVNVPEAK